MKAHTSPSTIPLIDIRPWAEPDAYSDSDRMQVAEKVDQACRLVGFFAIQHHGIDRSVIDQAWTASRDFFDLSSEAKLTSKTDEQATYPYGYENTECLVIGRNQYETDIMNQGEGSDSMKQQPDTKETFSLGPPDGSGMPARRFPLQPATFKPAMTAYYQSMEGLALTLMRIFAVALELPDPAYFDSFLDKHWSALRSLNYPAMHVDKTDDDDDDVDNTSIRIRAGEHTDYGALTILRTDGPGLQVQAKADDGIVHWIDVPILLDDDVFIINLGDMMQRWTNDEWVSTLHRVLAVKDSSDDGDGDSDAYGRRQSMAYFCNVNGHAMVSPLSTCCTKQPAKYEPILAKDHLMAKHLASMGYSSKVNDEK